MAKAPAAGFDARARAAVRRGLAYLARHQNDDGSWTDRVGRKVYTSYRGERNPHVGVTALAGIAFLAGGTLADQGPGIYVDRRGNPIPGSRVVSRALEYIVRQTSPTGFITAHGSRMYSHAFAALFLAEAYGMGIAPGGGRVRDCLRRAVRTIVNAQNDEGGWRYRPQADDSDMSITVCQVMALRAARNAGVRVPRETIDAAVRYVRGSFIPEIGAFTYQISNFRDFRRTPSRHSFALTAAGVATMYGAGEYASLDVIRPALRYLWRERPSRAEARYHFDYYYAQYYAVQALFQRGGAEWRRWYEGYIKPDLLALQEPEGCWSDLVGPNYATAMAAIILQFPNQYLPITEN